MSDLSGQVAVVTDSSRGIGKGVALELGVAGSGLARRSPGADE